MAAERHRWKPVPLRAAIGIGATVAFLGALASVLPTGAATTEHVVVDRNSGLAIGGFDPMAYFTEGAALLGKGEFEYQHAGAVWRFLNPGNRGAFIADPDVYMPRFGGYDPLGIARRVATPGDPRLWLIADKQLYLFYSTENKAAFAAGATRIGAAADREWPIVRLSLSP